MLLLQSCPGQHSCSAALPQLWLRRRGPGRSQCNAEPIPRGVPPCTAEDASAQLQHDNSGVASQGCWVQAAAGVRGLGVCVVQGTSCGRGWWPVTTRTAALGTGESLQLVQSREGSSELEAQHRNNSSKTTQAQLTLCPSSTPVLPVLCKSKVASTGPEGQHCWPQVPLKSNHCYLQQLLQVRRCSLPLLP